MELARTAAEYPGAIYCTHMRDESYKEAAAVRETLDLGRDAGIHVHISHHKIEGKGNEGLSRVTLGMVDSAISDGQWVSLDAYPYDACATALINCIPPKYRTVGTEVFLQQLQDPALRARIKNDLAAVPAEDFENLLGMTGFDRTLTQDENGMLVTLEELATRQGKDPYDAFFDRLIETGGTAPGIYREISADDMHDILRHPSVMVGTDCAYVPLSPAMHPRFRASFPHFLTLFCRNRPCPGRCPSYDDRRRLQPHRRSFPLCLLFRRHRRRRPAAQQSPAAL